MVLKVLSLCAGYGGLDLGLAEMGLDVELVAVSEISGPASDVLEARFDVPNLGDLTMIDDVPEVDVVTAGFPCQPVSVAGLRQGIHDERWLIDDVCKVARRSGARWLFLENVAGLLTANDGHAMARTVSALAHTGFAAEWSMLRASDVGAPHTRRRWFCVATAADTADTRLERWGHVGAGDPEQRVSGEGGAEAGAPAVASGSGVDPDRRLRRRDAGSGGEGRRTPVSTGPEMARAEDPVSSDPSDAADTDDVGWDIGPGPGAGEPSELGGYGSGDDGRTPVADPDHVGREGEPPGDGEDRRVGIEGGSDPDRRRLDHFGDYRPAIEQWERIVGRYAPDATTHDGRKLNPVFVEWMMGLPEGWVTDVVTNRNRALEVLGGGVVPQQAAAAYTMLAEEASWI